MSSGSTSTATPTGKWASATSAGPVRVQTKPSNGWSACQAGLEKGAPADRPYLWVLEHASDSTFVNVPVSPTATRQQAFSVSSGGVVTSRFTGSEVHHSERVITRQAGAASLTAVLVPQDAVDAGITRGPGLTYIDARTCTLVPSPVMGG